jgi:FMN-dependent NADH-azoreductase
MPILKLWIDQVVRSGRTCSYVAGGPKGLLAGKKVTVVIAIGGLSTKRVSDPWLP